MYDCSRSAITLNNLNLPYYDVHSREGRDQMLVNLYELQASFVKINDELNAKAKSQNERIQKLKERIRVCKDKIDGVENINKAIIFCSPGEYPKKYKFDPQKNTSIFKQFLQRTRVTKFDLNAHYQMKHDLENLGDKSRIQINQLYNFVLFLYSELKGKKTNRLEKGFTINRKEVQNLGRIPATISYVDCLTIFNTNINPYKQYQIVDNSLKKTVKKKELPKENIQVGTDLRTLQDFTTDEYDSENRNYRPIEKPVDDIDFDDTIGLDGVVDLPDPTAFISKQPSMVNKKIAKDPFKDQNMKEQENQEKSMESSQVSSSSSNLLPPQSSNLSIPPPPQNIQSNNLPPPPPPPTNLQSNLLPPPPPPPTNTQSNLLPPPPPPPTNLQSNLLPPPPPPPTNINSSNLPPPPSLSSDLPPPPSLTNNLSAPILDSSPPPAVAGRSALLSQLNNPNPMARLKKTITKEYTGPSSRKKAEESGGGGASGSNGPPPVDPQRPRAMTMMEALQLKIKNRFIALHPERQQVGEESDEN